MIKNTPIYIMILALAAFVQACRTHGADPVTVSRPSDVVYPDESGIVAVDVDFNIPANTLSKRNRLFITPTLFVGDSAVAEYRPVVLDSRIFDKKTERRRVLHGYVDPYADVAKRIDNRGKDYVVSYKDSLRVPDGVGEARLAGVVSSDGCGQCTGIDTVEMAQVGAPLIVEEKYTAHFDMIEPEFVVRPKIHNGKGEARLQFVVDKWDIVIDLADNRSELESVLSTLGPIVNDSLATLTSLEIFGSASAEASYAHNVKLAENRAKSARKWLTESLALPDSVGRSIKVGAAPEGWEPVVQAMIAANDADSVKVRELMLRYPGPTDDAAEKYIRRLACWPRIKKNYLAKDRKVTFNYTWTVRSFTNDGELIEMYRTRPDAFNEDEFVRVASLADSDESKILVYEKMLEYFPESAIAAHNLGALYTKAGRFEDARRVFKDPADIEELEKSER